MDSSHSDENKTSNLTRWLIPIGLAVGFFLWGLFIYYAVGDKGPPPWSFGIVEDIPGQSPYSTFNAGQFPGLESHPAEEPGVEGQRVMGPTPAVKILGKDVKP
jgi:hypothetical protein